MPITLSIIIATFNSEKTLRLVLQSIKKQTIPKEKIEIILVDGGSHDKTFAIAKRFHCKVINNPKTEPVYAKFLGYLQAKGKYIMYLDHDEVMENNKSIALKIETFSADKKIKAVIGSGYKNPSGYPFINNYINEFGDPFSFFMYRLSKDSRYFIATMKERFSVLRDEKDFVIFDMSHAKTLPLIELIAGGSMFDRIYFSKTFPESKRKKDLLPHFFYLLLQNYPYIAITKNDALLHYSSDIISSYLNKIRWRVKNNIYFVANMGESGFSGRQNFSNSRFRYKKYLFIPYAYTIVFCSLDSIYLVITRKDIRYFIHLPLCLFAASLILYHSILKACGYRPQLKSYDEKKVIE